MLDFIICGPGCSCFSDMGLKSPLMVACSGNGDFDQPPALFRQRSGLFVDLPAQGLMRCVDLGKVLFEPGKNIMNIFHDPFPFSDGF